MTYEEFLSRLEGRGPCRKCPAHDDGNASLSVKESDDGNILVKCQAGCSVQEVVAAMGLTMRDLFVTETQREERPVVPQAPPEPPPTWEQVGAWHERLRGHGDLLDRLYEVKGWTPKALERLAVGWDGARLTLPVCDTDSEVVGVRRYLPSGQPKMLAPRGTPRDLWPLPEHSQGPVLLVEGEPDAITAWSLDVTAVSVPGAATWGDSWAQRFKGRRVVIMFDCDAPGRKAAARVRCELAAVTWVRSIDLAPEREDGFDLTDLALAQRAAGKLDLLQRRLRALLDN